MVLSRLEFTSGDVSALQQLLEKRGRIRGPEFELSSGLRSNYYFNAKPVTMSAEGFDLVGRVMGTIVDQSGATAVGGLEIGSFPLGLSIAVASKRTGREIPDFLVRLKRKEHGSRERIAASYLIPMGGDCRVAIVDDVVTTGKSIEEAIGVVLEMRWEIIAVVTLVTRPENGGVSQMRSKFQASVGAEYISVFECDAAGNLTPLVDRFLTAPVA